MLNVTAIDQKPKKKNQNQIQPIQLITYDVSGTPKPKNKNNFPTLSVLSVHIVPVNVVYM